MAQSLFPPLSADAPASTIISEYASVELSTSTALMSKKTFLDAFGRGEYFYISHFYVSVECGDDSNFNLVRQILSESVVAHSVTRGGDPRTGDVQLRGIGWWALVDAGVGYLNLDAGSQDFELAQDLSLRVESRLSHRGVSGSHPCAYRDQARLRPVLPHDVVRTEVHSNYAPGTRDALERLVKLEHGDVGRVRRVTLEPGRSGTGKTWSYRVIVIDPEELIDDPLLLRLTRGDPGQPCRAVVVEDVDQLVERRASRSLSLSRPLNVTDGVVGTSHDAVLKATTNSSLDILGRSLLRPGRCLATVGVGLLGSATVSARLGDDSEGPSTGPPSELYVKTVQNSMFGTSLLDIPTGHYI